MNILISSAGRRVALLECFRQSLAELGIRGRVIAIDTTRYSPAGQLADAYHIVPKCTDAYFVAEVLRICEQEEVGLIVPTIDAELPSYANSLAEFSCHSIRVCISAPETISLCGDKCLSHLWLASHDFPVPRQSTPEWVLQNREQWQLPLIMKPRTGSGSVGFRVVASFAELEAICSNIDYLIVEELVSGAEHTVNVFVDRDSRCLCAVPHLRMEIRGGEVSKALTVKDTRLISLTCHIAETLPGAHGALNIQCFLTPSGEIRIIEINPRFGGGYPLAHRAGAHMTTWLLQEAIGLKPYGPFDQWQDKLLMLRYDQGVFLSDDILKDDSHVNSVCCVRSR